MSAIAQPVRPAPVRSAGARLLTAADLAALPSDLPSGRVLYELDNGRLQVMAPPGDEHGAFEGNLIAALKVQGEYRGLGKARCGEVGVILRQNPDRVVGADAVFIANASLPIRRSPEGYLLTVPDLVVEIRSKNDRAGEVQSKVNDYLAAGVKLVWVADPTTRTVTAHRPEAPSTVFGESDALVCEDLIPGFRLPVAEVFRD